MNSSKRDRDLQRNFYLFEGIKQHTYFLFETPSLLLCRIHHVCCVHLMHTHYIRQIKYLACNACLSDNTTCCSFSFPSKFFIVMMMSCLIKFVGNYSVGYVYAHSLHILHITVALFCFKLISAVVQFTVCFRQTLGYPFYLSQYGYHSIVLPQTTMQKFVFHHGRMVVSSKRP